MCAANRPLEPQAADRSQRGQEGVSVPRRMYRYGHRGRVSAAKGGNAMIAHRRLWLVLWVVGVCILVSGCISQVDSQGSHAKGSVVIQRDGQVVAKFVVDLALSSEEQRIGLMGREHLDPGTGMLFVFGSPGRYSMWMRNMLISLDFLFVAADGEILHIERDIPPCADAGPCPTVSAPEPIQYVVELPAGTVAATGIAVGDLMTWQQR